MDLGRKGQKGGTFLHGHRYTGPGGRDFGIDSGRQGLQGGNYARSQVHRNRRMACKDSGRHGQEGGTYAWTQVDKERRTGLLHGLG
jgi:hypothetical protein